MTDKRASGSGPGVTLAEKDKTHDEAVGPRGDEVTLDYVASLANQVAARFLGYPEAASTFESMKNEMISVLKDAGLDWLVRIGRDPRLSWTLRWYYRPRTYTERLFNNLFGRAPLPGEIDRLNSDEEILKWR